MAKGINENSYASVFSILKTIVLGGIRNNKILFVKYFFFLPEPKSKINFLDESFKFFAKNGSANDVLLFTKINFFIPMLSKQLFSASRW